MSTREFTERTLEAMYAYELAGSEEGARELLLEVTKVDHEARTVEMRKVGSTDICGKSLALTKLDECSLWLREADRKS